MATSTPRRFGFRTDLMRAKGERGERVTFVELFFDLVFVFAITQIAHTLVIAVEDGRTAEGFVQAAITLLAVWWVWVYTTWVTNWLDPNEPAVRGMLLALMVLGLVMSTSIPEAFGDRALLFVLGYVAMQIGRGVFVILAMAQHNAANMVNVIRLTIWFTVSAAFWFAGAFAGDLALQTTLWLIAIAIEYAGPANRYWLPFLGRSLFEEVPMRGGHMAERAGLFVILAIGESILVTGKAFTDHPIDAPNTLAFAAALTGSFLLWLLYFSRAEEGGSKFIQRHNSPGLVAGTSYTYIHVVLVAGIVLVAVADELVLAHPNDPASLMTLAVIYGAPALYLFGNLIFKHSVGAPWLKSHVFGTVALAIVFAISALVPTEVVTPVAHAWISNLILLGVVISEEVASRSYRIPATVNAE